MIVQFAVNEKVSTISCSDCRERRVKCDRMLPACLRCTKRKVPCYYNFKGRQKLKKTHFIDSLPILNINEVKQNEIINGGGIDGVSSSNKGKKDSGSGDKYNKHLAYSDPRNDLKLSKKKLIEYIPTSKLGTPLLLNTDLTPIGKKLLLALLTSDKSKLDELLSLPHYSTSLDFLVGNKSPNSPIPPSSNTATMSFINPDSSQFFLKLHSKLSKLNLEGSQLSKLIQSDNFQNLFDPQFWQELIDIYINRVHIFYPIFNLKEFQKNRGSTSNCLLSSMYYIGYLCRPNQDPFLCQYLKEYCLRQISKLYYRDRLPLLYSMMIMASTIGYSNNITLCKFFLTQAIRIAYSLGLHRSEGNNLPLKTKMLRANIWNILISYDITGNSFFGMDSFIPEVYFRRSNLSPNCISSGIISNNGYIPLNLSFIHKFDLPRGTVPNQSMFWYKKGSGGGSSSECPNSSPSSNGERELDDHYNSVIDEVQPKCLYLFRYIIEKFVLPISYHIRKLSLPNENNEFLSPDQLLNQIKLINLSLDSAYIFGLTYYQKLSQNYEGDQLAPTIITPFVWGFVLMLKSFSIIVNSQRPHSNLNSASPLPPNQLKRLLQSSKQLAHITSLYPPNFVSFRYIYIIRAATILFQEYPHLPLSAQPDLRKDLKIIYEQIALSSVNYAPFKDLLPKLKNIGIKLGFDISA